MTEMEERHLLRVIERVKSEAGLAHRDLFKIKRFHLSVLR